MPQTTKKGGLSAVRITPLKTGPPEGHSPFNHCPDKQHQLVSNQRQFHAAVIYGNIKAASHLYNDQPLGNGQALWDPQPIDSTEI